MSNGKKKWDPVPAGDYLLRMNRAEVTETKNGKGRYLKCGFQVVSGDHKDRLVFENFLFEHTSKQAADIGKERLDKYLKAVGVEDGLAGIGHDVGQIENYLETPFIASLKIEENEQYGDSNKITKFSAR